MLDRNFLNIDRHFGIGEYPELSKRSSTEDQKIVWPSDTNPLESPFLKKSDLKDQNDLIKTLCEKINTLEKANERLLDNMKQATLFLGVHVDSHWDENTLLARADYAGRVIIEREREMKT